MSLRVSSTQNVYNYQKQLNAADERQSKLMEQGDGNKIHRPSDDSVGYAKYLRYDISDSILISRLQFKLRGKARRIELVIAARVV